MRVVSAAEAICRLCQFSIVVRWPSVETVKLTFPHEKCVVGHRATAAQRARDQLTPIERWFARPDSLEDVGFVDFYEKYKVHMAPVANSMPDRLNGHVRLRQRGPKVITFPPARFATEKWYVRLILLQPGVVARGWRDLRKVWTEQEDGSWAWIEHDTYAAAASARGLMQDHKTAEDTLTGFLVTAYCRPKRARVLFCLVRSRFMHQQPCTTICSSVLFSATYAALSIVTVAMTAFLPNVLPRKKIHAYMLWLALVIVSAYMQVTVPKFYV